MFLTQELTVLFMQLFYNSKIMPNFKNFKNIPIDYFAEIDDIILKFT